MGTHRSLVSGFFLVVTLSISPRLGHSSGTNESSPAKRSPKEVIKSWFKTCRIKDEFKARACEQSRDKNRAALAQSFVVTGEFARLGRYDFDSESFPLEIVHPIGVASAKYAPSGTAENQNLESAFGAALAEGAFLTVAPVSDEDRGKKVMKVRGFALKLTDVRVPRATAEEFKRKNKKLIVELSGAVSGEWSYQRGATVLEAGFGMSQRTVFGIQLRVDRVRVWNAKTKVTFFDVPSQVEWGIK